MVFVKKGQMRQSFRSIAIKYLSKEVSILDTVSC